MSKLKCYFVEIEDGELGFAVISENSTNARKIACKYGDVEFEYTSAKQRKEVEILDTDKEGDVLEAREGMVRKAYMRVSDEPQPSPLKAGLGESL